MINNDSKLIGIITEGEMIYWYQIPLDYLTSGLSKNIETLY